MLGLGLLAVAGTHSAQGPGPRARALEPLAAEALLDNAACVRCHTEQARDWSASSHQTAFVDPAFQVAHAIEPRAYCRACHAPEADPADPGITPAASLGVACVSCHVRDGEILAGPGPARSADSPHAVRRDAGLDQPASCGACHEFDFPDGALRDRPLAMQRTVTEHAGSRFAARSCVSCHMPRLDDGRRSHRFAASRDPAMLRDAVRVAAERRGPSSVRITLRPGRVGHAFPTGDLLRRIEVGAVAVGPAGEGEPRRRYLARHFGDRAQRSGIVVRDELFDDRVPARGLRVVDLELPDAPERDVRWWVDYQRVAHQRSSDPRDAVLDGSLALAGGTLAPAHREPR
ncbi:Doubled CXXCH motif [Enhygromyxa salina]|uniref:Doubled CXXCH motif n=1 Tax=Enhygromyxa salina TaxID=215803 RepID=A0A2S9YBG5_9BACT|nr:multiheme c-type cytochrome [Enhygromyxa salina]PRQ02346.1 Doubled CXXCH motif [Enhygromyxa salina]